MSMDDDKIDRIERLRELRASGDISDDEFDALKAEVLADTDEPESEVSPTEPDAAAPSTNIASPYSTDDYEQTAVERLLLRPGVRFKGMNVFDSRTWKPWVFGLLLLTGGLAVAVAIGNTLGL
jgi:hypothetical protein